MATAHETLQVKASGTPEEVRPFAARGHVDICHLASGDAGLGTFEPGWRWSQDVKPIAGTDSCQVHHIGYCLSGRMRIALDDGTEAEVGPGDFYEFPPGHDGWVVGDEACVMLDFGGLSGYAKPH